MKKFKPCSLLDLPVVPYHRDTAARTQVVQGAYLRERRALRNPNELRPFIRRWQNMWLLRPGNVWRTAQLGSMLYDAAAPLLWSERAMLEGHFDAQKVLAYLLQQPNEGPLRCNPDERDWQICGHLCIPGPMLHAFKVSSYFGVGHDLGLVRLYLDSYPEFIDRLREGDTVFGRNGGSYDYDPEDEDDEPLAKAV